MGPGARRARDSQGVSLSQLRVQKCPLMSGEPLSSPRPPGQWLVATQCAGITLTVAMWWRGSPQPPSGLFVLFSATSAGPSQAAWLVLTLKPRSKHLGALY